MEPLYPSDPNDKVPGATTDPHIVAADRLNDAIVVAFDNGICAKFPASLLHSLIPQLDASAVETEA